MTTPTNKLQQHVLHFHEAFGHPIADTPKPISLQRATARAVWTAEECIEMIQASSSNKEEFAKAFWQFSEGMKKAYLKSLNSGDFPQTDFDKTVALADAITDQLYFSFGSAVEIGVDIEEIFNIVQSANMSKLFTDENGKKYAKYREDGKILKSPEFFAPEEQIKLEVHHQVQKAKYEAE